MANNLEDNNLYGLVLELKKTYLSLGVDLNPGLTKKQFELASGLSSTSPLYLLYSTFNGMAPDSCDPRFLYELLPLNSILEKELFTKPDPILKDFIFFGAVMWRSNYIYVSKENVDDIYMDLGFQTDGTKNIHKNQLPISLEGYIEHLINDGLGIT